MERPKRSNSLQVTSMIDIVFLLLVFFVMTFKVVQSEGDFQVRLPEEHGPKSDVSSEIPLHLKLTADNSGNLQRIELNDLDFGVDFQALRRAVVDILGDQPGPFEVDRAREIEIDADYNLRYEYTIEAITMVTGRRQAGQTVQLIENVKFAKPHRL